MTVKVQSEGNSAAVVFDWRPVLAMGQACIRIGWIQSKCNDVNFHPYNILILNFARLFSVNFYNIDCE